MMSRPILWAFCGLCLVLSCPAEHRRGRLGRVVVKFEKYDGPATVVAQSVDRYKVKIDVDRRPSASRSRSVSNCRTRVATRGRRRCEVRDARPGSGGAAERNRVAESAHSGAGRARHLLRAGGRSPGASRRSGEKERQLTDPATGLSLAIARGAMAARLP